MIKFTFFLVCFGAFLEGRPRGVAFNELTLCLGVFSAAVAFEVCGCCISDDPATGELFLKTGELLLDTGELLLGIGELLLETALTGNVFLPYCQGNKTTVKIPALRWGCKNLYLRPESAQRLDRAFVRVDLPQVCNKSAAVHFPARKVSRGRLKIKV